MAAKLAAGLVPGERMERAPRRAADFDRRWTPYASATERRPAGPAAQEAANPAEVDSAMAAFHGAYVGVNLTDDADQLFEHQQPWTTANGEQPDPKDGHCIVKVKADGSQYDAGTCGVR